MKLTEFWVLEAARQTIYNEILESFEFNGTYINSHHLELLCDRMTCNEKMTSIFRHGINNDNIGPIAKASFEETPEMFLTRSQTRGVRPDDRSFCKYYVWSTRKFWNFCISSNVGYK